MTPEQFLQQVRAGKLAPVYLFLGPETYRREQCRRVLIDALFSVEDRAESVVHHDLDDIGLATVLDDARSLSLFASRRLLYISSAEAALPRGRAAAAESEEEGPGKEGAGLIAAYLADPSPDTTLIFEAARYGFDGEDKTKLERVRKFYAAIPNVVECKPLSTAEASRLARQLAQQVKLQIGAEELDLLVEALDADASRLAVEIEKLSLYAGTDRAVTPADIAALVPNGRSATIFELVAAIGKQQTTRALELLDLLVREGEYLPLALSFLGTQFRQALAAKEAGLRGAQQIQNYFSRQGMPMWRARAEQIEASMAAFSKAQLRQALEQTFQADRGLRETRPDDRVVMEQYLLGMRKGGSAR